MWRGGVDCILIELEGLALRMLRNLTTWVGVVPPSAPPGVLETAGSTLWGTRTCIFMRFVGDLRASKIKKQLDERGSFRGLAAWWGEEMAA